MRQAAIGRDMTQAIAASAKLRKGLPAKNRISVSQYGLNGDFIKKYASLAHAAESVNGVRSAFSALKKGKLKTYKSFLWKFEN